VVGGYPGTSRSTATRLVQRAMPRRHAAVGRHRHPRSSIAHARRQPLRRLRRDGRQDGSHPRSVPTGSAAACPAAASYRQKLRYEDDRNDGD